MFETLQAIYTFYANLSECNNNKYILLLCTYYAPYTSIDKMFAFAIVYSIVTLLDGKHKRHN